MLKKMDFNNILAGKAGDWAQKNFAPEAELLLEWLSRVNPDYADPPCTYPE